MIRIGIVGCGRILAAHLRGYRLLREAGFDQFRITALCSRKADDARMYAKRGEGPPQRPAVSDIPGDPLAVGDEYLSDFQPDTDVAIYDDYREMIRTGPIDAVNDFSIHSLHHQVAAEAFEHGKDLLSQKPLAVTVKAARAMCEKADACQRIFGVFENVRFNPINRKLKWLIRTGRLGTLQLIQLAFVACWWAPDLVVAQTPWRHRKEEGGGLALDLGVHFLDLMRQVAGEPLTVSGQTTVLEPIRVIKDSNGNIIEKMDCDADDTFFANVHFSEGAHATLAASWGGRAPKLTLENGVVFWGTKGRITGDDILWSDGSSGSLEELYQQEATKAERDHDFPMGLQDGFALAQYDWLRAVQNRTQPETSGEEGLRDLAAAFAILESAHAHRQIDVDDVITGKIHAYQQPIDTFFKLI